ncbi:hypothetical protein [Paracraurococcus lichenis]|uniref:Uncharacterized protein n=1 Tax=Paracraurococcus lichenis TaxID=3064888 RepID=A0ABT9EC72_9PROT|nr:hypothetical protein [Paracraurococcus sp. LOR1-02]MDO9713630.1 hypothetical protein [Paracraurococcus sp. LOR1-02]
MRVEVADAVMGEPDETRLPSDVIAEVEPLAKHGEIGNGRSRGSDTTSTAIGRGADYLAARIKRDRPDIAARIDDFSSMVAAAPSV